ncbi:ATP-binding cassette domain-containing protein [Nostoc sp. CMAA1605]|uniref:ATP-binding cassette domain-containing protein n=1 Tax=Nostoc sp. CMAA1605 TaxID=2055159 RepID=UPI001F2C1025|nr:ATP-binding cassette domain-containing protein [Nostoc sp. CMAA1605]MCF4969843.1 ABC transporter ATP-binding protein [Nostoc sp. CMAA1605]
MSTRKLLFKFAKPYPGWIFLTVLLGFSGALFNGVSTTLIVPIVLKIVGQEIDLSDAPPILKSIMIPFDSVQENYRILVMSLAIIALISLKNLASYASSLTSSSFTRKLTSDIREAGLQVLLEVDLDYFAKMRVGDLLNSLGGEMGRAATSISNVIKLIITVITIFVFIGLLLSISWQLTIASTILLSFVTLINQYAMVRAKKFGHMLSEMSRVYSIAVLETLNGIRLVKATGNEEKEFNRIRQLIRDREQADYDSQANSQVIAPLSEVMGITALLLIVFLSRVLFADQVNALSAVLLTYLLVLLRLLPLVSQLNSIRNTFANSAPSVNIVSEFLRRDNKPFMASGDVIYEKLEKGIHFNSLSFNYPGHDKSVLKDVSLFLPRGTTLALVGGSGAGKSTLADLLPRFYDPISGSITVDGRDLRDFDVKSWRKRMGIVSQDTFLFNESVKENIAYGRQDATEAEIIAATKRANAYEFISKLPQGFDTMIGDRGVMLSGGQRQRLAIARALLQNPEILILDEATSALDTVSERLVQAALDDLSRDRTTLVIAHRLSTVQNADQIAVLDQGQVVEVGTHEQLLQKGGYYARLYSMQFSNVPETSNYSNQSLLRISHELRNKLNSMIGVLHLLLDEMTENNQEDQALIEDSYKSTFKILNTLEIFEDIVQQQNHYLTNASSHNQDDHVQMGHLQKIQELNLKFNALLVSLRSLTENYLEAQQNRYQTLNEALHLGMNLLSFLENFENKIHNN